MGCVSSSQAKTDGPTAHGGGAPSGVGSGKKVGNVAGNNAAGAPGDIYDKPPMNDPRVPLTRREIFLAGKSWKGVTRNMEDTGMSMMNKLLAAHPEFADVIKANVKDDDKENAIVATADSIMNGYSKAILLLEDYDKFRDFLYALGNSYQHFKNFDPAYFEKLREPFLDAIKETLEDRYTENIENIYKKTFNFIIENMIEGYNKT